MSWRHPDDQPRGRSTLWLHPAIPLRFVFDDPEPAELSRQWIEELANSANSSTVISLVAEHFDRDAVPVAQEGATDSASERPIDNVQIDRLKIDRLNMADAPE